MLKIGSFELPSNILLAPMAGCTDLPFRLIAREHGAKFCFFEMVDCNSITYGAKRTVRSILNTIAEDSPIAAQLLGRDPEKMLAGAGEMLAIIKPAFLDINAACPARKVIKKKCGAYLLKDESELCSILKKLSSGLSIPVTVKLRAGYDKPDPAKMATLAKRCQDSGAAAIFVHGRTQAQGYSGPIDYASIKAIKDAVKIPVFGSGNIFSTESARKMLDDTGCDGILVARGALGNPWIFKEIEHSIARHCEEIPSPVIARRIQPDRSSTKQSQDGLGTGSAISKMGVRSLPARGLLRSFGARNDDVTKEERVSVLKKHISAIEKFKAPGHRGNVGHMRKTVFWYLKGFPQAARVREKVSAVDSYEKMLKLIDTL